MTPSDAIGAASWAARDWLGYRSIEEGAAADVIAYESDPRTDLNALRHPSRIILRGRVIR
jgi:imidazolonepropionase-like amidohydrolase